MEEKAHSEFSWPAAAGIQGHTLTYYAGKNYTNVQ